MVIAGRVCLLTDVLLRALVSWLWSACLTGVFLGGWEVTILACSHTHPFALSPASACLVV